MFSDWRRLVGNVTVALTLGIEISRSTETRVGSCHRLLPSQCGRLMGHRLNSKQRVDKSDAKPGINVACFPSPATSLFSHFLSFTAYRPPTAAKTDNRSCSIEATDPCWLASAPLVVQWSFTRYMELCKPSRHHWSEFRPCPVVSFHSAASGPLPCP